MIPRLDRWRRSLSPLALGLASVALGYHLSAVGATHGRNTPGSALRLSGGLTRPLLTCEAGRESAGLDLASMEAVLSESASLARAAGRATSFSVRFVDLSTGAATGVGEGRAYCPASLMKLADLITLLRRAEAEPGLLERPVLAAPGNDRFAQNVKPRHPLEPGHSYRVETLAEHMIVESDNLAAFALHEVIAFPEVVATLDALRIPLPDQPRPDTEFMTVGAYARLLEVLYNATYLNAALSEKALTWLSAADTALGLVDGTPPGVRVAHKFGERVLPAAPEAQREQFHDCGIVYHPRRPYVLCAMSAGEAQDGLTEAVAETARRVYAEVDRQTHPVAE